METDKLYRVTRDDIGRLIGLLAECFRDDPLYRTLLPDERHRLHLLPTLFECDMDVMFESCEMYADSPACDGLIVVDDETEPYNPLKYYSAEAFSELKADAAIVLEDPSLRSLCRFLRGREYLTGEWVEDLHSDRRLHIIYLAVRPSRQGQGVARALVEPVLDYADAHGLAVSLETHNPHNVPLYEHYGFRIFEVLDSLLPLRQYCMVRPLTSPGDRGMMKQMTERSPDPHDSKNEAD